MLMAIQKGQLNRRGVSIVMGASVGANPKTALISRLTRVVR